VRIPAAASAYLTSLQARRGSPALLEQSRRALALFMAAARGRDIRRIEEAHLVAFARDLATRTTPHGRPLSLASQAVYLQRVKSFFAFLAKAGVLLSDPAQDLALPQASSLPRLVLSERQAERLVTAPSSMTKVGRRDRAILEALYGTGIRRGECVRLDIADVDLAQGALLVRQGKGGCDRRVPLPKRALLALSEYLRGVRPALAYNVAEPALFLTAWKGRRLTESALVALLRTHAKAAGLERVHLHALRHACATHLIKGGASVRHVQAILGHASLTTTARYTAVAIADLRAVFARSHPRERAERTPNSGRMSMEIRP
jgi:integrase/recombinase XerD